jgi:hypothetical protein
LHVQHVEFAFVDQKDLKKHVVLADRHKGLAIDWIETTSQLHHRLQLIDKALLFGLFPQYFVDLFIVELLLHVHALLELPEEY